MQKSLQFVADDLKVAPVDAVIWLQLNGADRAGGARMRGFSLPEIDLDHIMQQDFTATCTDGDIARLGQGTPHARFYGTMARKIRYYSLDRGVISLPHAIRSMTSLAAQIIGLKDRGLVQTGYWADLVVFDPKTVADKADVHRAAPVPDRHSVRVRERRGGGGRRQAHAGDAGKGADEQIAEYEAD